MCDEDWDDFLRRLLDDPTATRAVIRCKFEEWAETQGSWKATHLVADEAFHYGMEKASLALA